jgi:predicted ATPase
MIRTLRNIWELGVHSSSRRPIVFSRRRFRTVCLIGAHRTCERVLRAMTELSSFAFETVWNDGEFILSKITPVDESSPILALAPAVDQPAVATIARLEHAYALRSDLHPAWAARPVELVRHYGKPVLLIEDHGGEVLARILGRPWDLKPFLRVATGLAVALGRLHQCGLVHRDVKPGNIFVNIRTGEVWLSGFGLAARLPRERQMPEASGLISGTLAYMAPEQTGRMNRSVDSRSDLYSLGITFYEMLTGELPFRASEPMEWIHCHIARQPVAPDERVNDIPRAVSGIISKLLSKNAEDRYQTAAGLDADLRNCLDQWEPQRRIDLFALGEHDIPDQLLIPERLYGREDDVQVLLTSFGRIVAGGTPEVVLVSGYSGIGKSSVVNELQKALVPPRALFASGKFDQYKRDIPYATLAQAFNHLVRSILALSEQDLGQWRHDIQQALAPNGRLIVNLIPELELITGQQQPVPDLPAQEAQNRFQMVFRRFVGLFARPEHPLALFLDDLQWLDAATLDLFELLVTDPELHHLLLIGAYRDNEVDSAHPLIRRLETIHRAGVGVHQIVLTPLRLADLNHLIADTLRCDAQTTYPLARLVEEKTNGNPFFAIQFIIELNQEGLIAFDRNTCAWAWDLDRIRAKNYTDNVVDFIVGKLNRLSRETQDALKHFACQGNRARTATLALTSRRSAEEVNQALSEAVLAGLVFYREAAYAFLHDRVQEAAYSLIPEEERAAAHLEIGRLLAAHTSLDKREDVIFEIVNQFNRGTGLITSRAERDQVAELNLIAGRRAKTSTAYASALTYLTTGRALLEENSWERQHALTFALELQTAECQYLAGDLAAAEDRLSMLCERAVGLVEQAAVTCLRVDLYANFSRSDRAVAVCLDYLRHFGVDWSSHPTREEARREYERIWSQLGSRTIEEIVDLPLMNDPASLATLDVLTRVLPPALFTDANLVSLAACGAVNLSLERGNTDGSCFAYVWLGMMAGPLFGNYKAGSQFGRLGCELVEKRGLKRFEAGTYVCFGNIVMPWTKHIKAGRDLLRRGFETANRIGDLTSAAYTCNNLNTNLLAAGDPLPEVQREVEDGLKFAQKVRFGMVIDIITAQLGFIRSLRGLRPKFGCLDDGQLDETQFERHLANHAALSIAECWYWIRKLQARFFAGDYPSAVDASLRAQRLLWTSTSLFETAEYTFYSALSHAASCDPGDFDQHRQHLEDLVVHHKQLEVWAENCPENFADRAALVAAEIARLHHREIEAMQLYEQAIHSARENGFIHNEGLANELAGRFYLARGAETSGYAHLRSARYCYLHWGALGKVKQLN